MRLIEQALVGLGYGDIAADLEQRSGVTLQVPAVERFRDALLAGSWRAALALLPELSVGDEKRMKEVGPGRYCSPHHPTHSEPLSLVGLKGTL